MRVDEVELRVISIPLRTPFVTSYAVETDKLVVLATVRSDGVEGYGEGVMDPLPIYREETVEGAMFLLREALVPSLLGQSWTHPSELNVSWQPWRGNPMAKATLELAVWDCYARQQQRSLASLYGATRHAIPVGASLGIDTPEATVESVGRHLAQGYRRVKLKIKPGADIAVLSAVRAEYPHAPLTVDANSAYTLADVDLLRAFDDFDLHYIEQPLHWDDLTEHAHLAEQLRTPICLDESLTSAARTAAALDLGAARVVNLKVGRVGGITESHRIHELCTRRSVDLWCGGMLETGIGRAHNIHLAAMPGFTLPGDTASASRTYVRDIVTTPLEAERGSMPVPQGDGIGVDLDRDFLTSLTRHVEVIRR